MSVIGYILLAACFVYLFDLITRELLSKANSFDRFKAPIETNHEIVYLPGILAHGVTSSNPLRPTWLEFGNVLCFSYGSERFVPRRVIEYVANSIIRILSRKKSTKLTLMFSSMGAVLGLSVWAKIRDRPSVPKETEMVILDGIQGAQNMKPRGILPVWLMRVLLFFLRFGPILNMLLSPVFNLMKQPPKDDEIQRGLNKTDVKREAKAAMAPYKLSFWRDQLSFIANYEELSPKHFKGLTRVYYLSYTENNVTVKQPEEARKWERACSKAGVPFVWIEIPAPHCSFAQMPRRTNDVLREILDGSLSKNK